MTPPNRPDPLPVKEGGGNPTSPPSAQTSGPAVDRAATDPDHTTAIVRLLVRTDADMGNYQAAADRWMRHLADREEAAQIAWGHALGGCPVDEYQARQKARDAQTALVAFTTAARNSASKAVGSLVAGWSV